MYYQSQVADALQGHNEQRREGKKKRGQRRRDDCKNRGGREGIWHSYTPAVSVTVKSMKLRSVLFLCSPPTSPLGLPGGASLPLSNSTTKHIYTQLGYIPAKTMRRGEREREGENKNVNVSTSVTHQCLLTLSAAHTHTNTRPRIALWPSGHAANKNTAYIQHLYCTVSGCVPLCFGFYPLKC